MNIKIQDYNYNLPEERIAKYPVKERDKSKLLIYKQGVVSHDNFDNLVSHLPESSLLFFNNTHVIRARLEFFKETGARIEIFCLEPHLPADYERNFASSGSVQWVCIVGNLKKWKHAELTRLLNISGESIELSAILISNTPDKKHIIEFSWNTNHSFSEILEHVGQTPIPPYLNRNTEKIDEDRYQTVYAKYSGSVAAPTAGLHFTDKTMHELQKKNISYNFVTLHVGAGTFVPVKADEVMDHTMHTEHFFIKKQVVQELIHEEKKIIAVGTTTLRTLESIYWTGVKLVENHEDISVNQWYPYECKREISQKQALTTVLEYMDKNNIEVLENQTSLMIVPGYQFRLCDILITNFHQPQSTLLLLVAAFTNNNWKKIYNYALNNEFRFLSYGDSSLIFR